MESVKRINLQTLLEQRILRFIILSKAYIHTYIPPVALSGFLQKNLQSALLVEKAPVKTKQPKAPQFSTRLETRGNVKRAKKPRTETKQFSIKPIMIISN